MASRLWKRGLTELSFEGAKVHTSCTPYVDEVIVLPSRSMGQDDEPWSVAFAVPAATPGLRMYASDFLHGGDPFTRPISTSHKMIETLTVFDDVFVPWERVFFHNRPDLAGSAALTFVEYHRYTAVSYEATSARRIHRRGNINCACKR